MHRQQQLIPGRSWEFVHRLVPAGYELSHGSEGGERGAKLTMTIPRPGGASQGER